jgi:hypothetical protein
LVVKKATVSGDMTGIGHLALKLKMAEPISKPYFVRSTAEIKDLT